MSVPAPSPPDDSAARPGAEPGQSTLSVTQPSTRRLLLVMAVGVLAPLILLAGLNGISQFELAREAARSQTADEARLLAATVDRQIAAVVTTLNALVSSPDLRDGDLVGLHARLNDIPNRAFDVAALVRRDGQLTFHSLRPLGSELPRSPLIDLYAPAFDSDTVIVSNLFRGTVSGNPSMVVARRTMVGDTPHVLSLAIHWPRFQELTQTLPGRIVTIVDREGTVIARSQHADKYVGARVPDDVRSLLLRREEGQTRTLSLEGIDVNLAFKRSQISGYTVVVAQPNSDVLAGPLELLLRAAAAALLAIALAVGAALWISRRIAASTEALAAAADTISRGGTPAFDAPMATSDLARVATALQGAAETIGARTAALTAATVEADRASKAKSKFLASMSHELRTPLNAVIGFAELIREQAHGPVGDGRYIEYANDIRDSGAHLLGMVNDLLDMARLEAGRRELRETRLSVMEEIAATLRLVRPAYDKADVRLVPQYRDDLPVLVADPVALRQMLLNLLDNAAKFTPTGGQVTISAAAGADADGGGLDVTVRDTGVGIPADRLPELGHPFAQVENVLTRQHSGTGIGLYIVRSLMELHGGTLRIASVEGQGTAVTLHFPMERLEQAPPMRVAAT